MTARPPRVTPALMALFLGALAVRAWAFGTIPGGLNQDEASTAYDAYALVHYGIDRAGNPFPVMLDAWGSGMYALASYVAAPFVALFGLNAVAIRLPHLLFGMLDLFVFTLLVQELTQRKQTTALAAFLLAIMPWHVMKSRWGLDSSLLPSFFLLGVTALVHSKTRPRFLYAASACFGLALYAYGTAYVAVPAFLLMAVAFGWRHGYWPRAPLMKAGAGFALLAAPIGLFVVINSLGWPSLVTPFLSIPRLSGTPRFQTTGNIHLADPQFLRNLWDNLGVAWRLLRTQDDGLPWNVIPAYGVVYRFALPLALLGFLLLCRECYRSRSTPQFFMLAWLLAATVLAAFVPVNINRFNVALFPLLYCVVLGVDYCRHRLVVFVPLVALYLVSFAGFVSTYFSTYPAQIDPVFAEGLTEALASAAGRGTAAICVTDDVNMPYIYALIAERADPHLFLQTVRYENPGEEFQRVSAYGRFTFGLQRCAGRAPDAYVIRVEEARQFAGRPLRRERFGGFLVLRPK